MGFLLLLNLSEGGDPRNVGLLSDAGEGISTRLVLSDLIKVVGSKPGRTGDGYLFNLRKMAVTDVKYSGIIKALTKHYSGSGCTRVLTRVEQLREESELSVERF